MQISHVKNSKPSLEYAVWDKPTRLFHWINLFLVITLIGLGLVIMNTKILQIGADGKILLKTIHSWFGYAFILNLLWRILWGFKGNHYARWSTIFPFGKDYIRVLRTYITSLRSGKPESYLGHNPVARLIITLMIISMCLQAATGLVLAGTDLYLPPLGHEIKEQLMAAGEDHEKIRDVQPGIKDNLDPEAYKKMRAFREPFIEVHEINFFLLLFFIFIHLTGVVITELKEGNAIISAMVNGKKYFTEHPKDLIDK